MLAPFQFRVKKFPVANRLEPTSKKFKVLKLKSRCDSFESSHSEKFTHDVHRLLPSHSTEAVIFHLVVHTVLIKELLVSLARSPAISRTIQRPFRMGSYSRPLIWAIYSH